MAAAIFRQLTQFGTQSQRPSIASIDSCGTYPTYVGTSAWPNTIAVLAEHGIEDFKHQARQFRVPDDIRHYDFVIMMDQHNRDTLRKLLEKGKAAGVLTDEEETECLAKCCFLGQFGDHEPMENVLDPSSHGMPVFKQTFEQIQRLLMGVLKHVEDPTGSPMLMAPKEDSDFE